MRDENLRYFLGFGTLAITLFNLAVMVWLAAHVIHKFW